MWGTEPHVPAGVAAARKGWVLRLAVLGSINRDTIASAGGRTTGSLGGELYTACAAAHLARAVGGDSAAVEVLPIARLGADVRAAVLDLVERTPAMTARGLLAWAGEGFHSHIQYLADGTKREVLTGDVPPLGIDEIAPFIEGASALLVNFITGFEMELDGLAAVRRAVTGPILMDVHSLTLGRRPGGERYWRRPSDWRRWLAAAQVVQMNRDEADVLMGPEAGDLATDDVALLSGFARQLVRDGARLAVITRGPLPVLAAARRRDGGIDTIAETPPPASAPADGDPTGCGDVFLAGLGVATLCGRGARPALQLANRAAALNCELSGLEELDRLAALS